MTTSIDQPTKINWTRSTSMIKKNDQSFEESREFIYREGEGVMDPKKGQQGPHIKGKIHNSRIKGLKLDVSTQSLFMCNHLSILEASSKRSFSSIFVETS